MFDAFPQTFRDVVFSVIAILFVVVLAAFVLSWAMEKIEREMVAELPVGQEPNPHATKLDILILDEDGDVDTVPPLSADQEAMLRKIDRVEQDIHRQLAFKGGAPRCGEAMAAMDDTAEYAVGGFWRKLQAQKAQSERALHGFPVSLIGRGVTIPAAHEGELA